MSSVAVIGPGRVGTAVALGLADAGYDIAAVAGTGEESASLAEFGRLVSSATATTVAAGVLHADLVVVSTPDAMIGQVARVAAAADAVHLGQRWIHTAGGVGLDPLSIVRAAGASIAACHPAMTFPDPVSGWHNLPGSSWAVTAEESDLDWARLLILDLRGSPVTVPAGSRTLYHAGLSVGSNATTAVASLARDLLLGAGIEDPSAFLLPLVTASAQGGAVRGVQALTGPISRGEDSTVRGHLEELRTSFPEAVQAYVALGELILAQAIRAGLSPERAQAVRAVLDHVATQ
ncbi:MAG: Rossmann-like and DUF2520 domain-containing protein [Euzebya sp.]